MVSFIRFRRRLNRRYMYVARLFRRAEAELARPPATMEEIEAWERWFKESLRVR
jgi:hypothetical protein